MRKFNGRQIMGGLVLASLAIGGVVAMAQSSSTTTTSNANTSPSAGATSALPVLDPSKMPAGGRGPGGPGGPPTVDTSAIRQKWVDVVYASKSAAEKLDIYLPNDGKGPFPVIVAIHGGAFKGGDKSGELNWALEALSRGYAVVSVNYRLSGEALFPAQINDVKAAIRWVRANADKYQLNAAKIAAWGGSAGGSLAALVGTSGDVKALEDLSLGNADKSSRVQAVVDWFGPINFLTMDAQFKASGIAGQVHDAADSPESELIGEQISKAPELVAKTNPETYVTADDPPFFIQHGTADVLIPTQQSIDFAALLGKTIGKDRVSYESLVGAGHGDAAFTAPANVKKALDFLDKYLK